MINSLITALFRGIPQSRGGITVPSNEAVAQKLNEWQRFYNAEFGLDLNLSAINIPEQKEGFERLIVVAQGITPQQVLDRCGKKYRTWNGSTNLDGVPLTNVRDAKLGHYAIWVRDAMTGYTLLERLLHELKYYLETGKHLYSENTSVCSGSRYPDGRVPFVDWIGNRLEVD